MKIAILSNVNVDSMGEKLNDHFQVYTPPGFNTWINEISNDNSGLNLFDPDVVFILIDGISLFPETRFEDAIPIIDDLMSFIGKYSEKNSKKRIIISNIDVKDPRLVPFKYYKDTSRIENAWVEKIKSLNRENIYIFDLQGLIRDNGRNSMYSDKGWYFGGMRFSMNGEKIIVSEVSKIFFAFKGGQKKCIVLDLDNTLWGGIIGEDGINGISLSDVKEGSQYKDFQKRLKDLKNMGVLLAIASKNNFDDAIEVIRNHPHMVLKEEDFVSMKINWDPKYVNIQKIAEDLNIGLNSIVFIDDDKFERESVKTQLPEVEVPDFPQDSTMLAKWITQLQKDYFEFIEVTEEDLEKTEMYKSQEKRKTLLEQSASFEDYLSSLEMKLKIWNLKKEDLPRAAQLTQKTNQFNVTTKRYTEFDLEKMMADPNFSVYIGSVADKFGDNGKVVFLIVKKDKDIAYIDTFLMSCRVMGRHIEDHVMDFVEEEMKKQGIKKIRASYIPTKKNISVKNLWDDLGYKRISEGQNGEVSYEIDLENKPERKVYSQLVI
ncbi:HAD-IIIC family phosphatase [Athalassotoga saccharophila]|uniref:HAD-IIIC family phosphatase n=1 Tax=Athalassotoga saccharophila TaxID=1441386 RepID=UPI00137AE684|nr:HAD-IIIC family phosphatase [Athalassotoga saccharophila]BBJ28315.1 FkbH like protein [Athalassotoga saccharophila]